MPMPSVASPLSRLLVPAALAAMLAGCGGNSQGLFGAPGTTVDPAGGGQRISDAAVAGVGGPSVTGPPSLTVGSGPDAIDYSCPMVDVRTGAAAWQVPASGGGLRYQGSISNMARECAIVDRTMTMKVGIEGRVLLGDKGTPGAVNVPIRIAVVQEGPSPKTITTKFFTVPLNIPAAEGQISFSVVEDTISFPLVSAAEIERYVVYVGFDPQGTETRPSRPRPARPAPSASAPAATAPAAARAPAASTPTATAAPAASSSAGQSAAPPAATFGPPPAASTFSAPPDSGTFGPPPATFGPPPASQ
ncbi:hypothetical protein [Aquabacter spiritensis]|uniref:Uncharacterized protein n=1 Tax=Aquabacter spiritensis TaxID=933073 RepID=A0A4R3M1F7_9HYPH|nr:hypothetical protein [Aquabacter spiritensis]TCT06009.1 hypothetical protein EDC64_103110 [Aquabacter spiritensis]